MPYHLLSEKDFEKRTAICSLCGPVRLKKIGPNWRCYEAFRRQRRHDRLYELYGVRWREWDQLLIAQSGRCAICGQPMIDPAVDHCHASGAVRGLLCRPCNQGLGFFRDDIGLLQAASVYLAADPSVPWGVSFRPSDF